MEDVTEQRDQAARIAYLENLNISLQEIIETLERRNAELVRELAILKAKK